MEVFALILLILTAIFYFIPTGIARGKKLWLDLFHQPRFRLDRPLAGSAALLWAIREAPEESRPVPPLSDKPITRLSLRRPVGANLGEDELPETKTREAFSAQPVSYALCCGRILLLSDESLQLRCEENHRRSRVQEVGCLDILSGIDIKLLHGTTSGMT
jgi:hypothetical protein